MALRFFAICLCCAASAWPSAYYSIDYLYHDIMRAKTGNQRIYEVRLRTAALVKVDTMVAVVGPDSVLSLGGAYRLEFDVLANLAGAEFPETVPLIVFDRRPQARRVWRNQALGAIHGRGGEEAVIVVDARGRLIAMYTEQSLIPGDDPVGAVTKEQIRQGVFALMDAKEYKDFIDRPNLARVLIKSGVLSW